MAPSNEPSADLCASVRVTVTALPLIAADAPVIYPSQNTPKNQKHSRPADDLHRSVAVNPPAKIFDGSKVSTLLLNDM